MKAKKIPKFIYTKDAWEYLQSLPKITIKERKNAGAKRKKYTPEFRKIVEGRSGGVCENKLEGVRCENRALPIHHIVPVKECIRKGIDQWDLSILIHLCVPCHRIQHPDIHEGFFMVR